MNRVCVPQENPEEARVTINSWISNKTENLIQDTLPQGALGSNTVLVLVNTIYFKVPGLGPQDTDVELIIQSAMLAAFFPPASSMLTSTYEQGECVPLLMMGWSER